MNTKSVSMDQLMEWADDIIESHAVGAEADAGFDGGEFSGPAHARMEEAALTRLAEANGYTYDELLDAINVRDYASCAEDPQ